MNITVSQRLPMWTKPYPPPLPPPRPSCRTHCGNTAAITSTSFTSIEPEVDDFQTCSSKSTCNTSDSDSTSFCNAHDNCTDAAAVKNTNVDVDGGGGIKNTNTKMITLTIRGPMGKGHEGKKSICRSRSLSDIRMSLRSANDIVTCTKYGSHNNINCVSQYEPRPHVAHFDENQESPQHSASSHKQDSHWTPPPPPRSYSYKGHSSRGRQPLRSASGGQPTPVSSDHGLAHVVKPSAVAERQERQEQRRRNKSFDDHKLRGKGLDVLTSVSQRFSSQHQLRSKSGLSRTDRKNAGSSKCTSSSSTGSGVLHFLEEKLEPLHKKTHVTAVSKDACTFDPQSGRCVYHPSVILAKKAAFRNGWDMVKVACPLCHEASKKLRLPEKSRTEVQCRQQKIKKSQTSLISYSTTKKSTCDKNVASVTKLKSSVTDGNNAAEALCRRPDIGSVRVARMPYTTPGGEGGWYSGSVNTRGIPHGQGCMHTKTGNTIEGEWTNGYLADESLATKNGKMKSGFDTKLTLLKDDILRSPSAPSVPSSQKPISSLSHQFPTFTHSPPILQDQRQICYSSQGQMMNSSQMERLVRRSPLVQLPIVGIDGSLRSLSLPERAQYQEHMNYPTHDDCVVIPSLTRRVSPEELWNVMQSVDTIRSKCDAICRIK